MLQEMMKYIDFYKYFNIEQRTKEIFCDIIREVKKVRWKVNIIAWIYKNVKNSYPCEGILFGL